MFIKSDIVTSRQNEAVKRLLALDDKKNRDVAELFVLDGLKLFEEAVKAGADIVYIYINAAKGEQLLQNIEAIIPAGKYDNVQLIRLEGSLFERVSREKSPQGVITLVKYLDKIRNIIKINKVTSLCAQDESARGGVLFLDGIQDPGNLGAIIRTAVAMGRTRLVLDASCVDIYHPRVLRAAMGGIFRLCATYTDDLVAAVSRVRASGHRVFAAELREGARPVQEVHLQPSDSIVIGNEGHGITPTVSAVCDGSVYLPIAPGTESLNAAVAASIFLWEMREV